MKLTTLHINRGWGDDGELRGEIKFATDGGNELKLVLDEQLSIDIVGLCADAIVRAGQEAAQSLTSEAMQVAAIEHQDSV